MKKLLALGLLSALLMPVAAFAHTIGMGTHNAGTPGSVTIWMASYHGGGFNQGSITLGAQTVAFGMGTAVMPSELTLGDNFFYADNTTTGSYTSLSDPCCGISSWQGATLTGLSAGTHTYTISGMTSVHWADWNSGDANWTGTIVIPESSTQAPEPGTLALLALGLVGIGFSRRRAA